MANKGARGRKPRKSERKNIPHAVAHIKSSFNNTIITISDQSGDVIAWASAGNVGFSGSRKSTPFAAQLAAEQVAQKAMEHGVRKVDVQGWLVLEVRGHRFKLDRRLRSDRRKPCRQATEPRRGRA